MPEALLRLGSEEASKQYMARKAVPDYPRYFAGWIARSKTLRQEHPPQRIMLGDNAREFVDLYIPDKLRSDQLQLFIHGGYWQSQHPDSFSFLAKPFLEKGIPFAVLGYPLCPDVTLLELSRSVRHSIGQLWQQRHSLALDINRLHISGHSAGGHLAVLMNCKGWGGDLTDAIGSTLALSGLFELMPLLHTPINDPIRLHSDMCREISPLRIETLLNVPHALVVGERESVAFHRQSEVECRHLQRQGISCERWDEPNCHHFSILDQYANPDSQSFRWVLSQMLSG